MIILLDHCVPRRYMRLLGEWGYQAAASTEHIAQDAQDSEVIALAQTLDAALLTIDMDFANILEYPPAKYGGIVVLRYKIEDEAEVDTSLRAALDDLHPDELRKTLVIVSPGRYRIRR